MMTNQPVQSLIDPVAQNKMPLVEGPLASERLSKPGDMSGFHSEQALQCRRSHFTYEPSEKDVPGRIPAWRNLKTSLLDGRIPLSHLSGMKGQNHVIYWPDNKAFSMEETYPHSSYVHNAPGKQDFTYYTRSPEISSPTAAPLQTAGDVNCSPPSENSVSLAIPKPIYGHSSCWNELGGVFGQRYSIEHGPQRMPSTVFEGEWTHADARYSNPSHIQRKATESLQQQSGLQLVPSTEQLPLKDMMMHKYQSMSPNKERSLPTYIDTNYSSYLRAPTLTPLSPLAEHSQHLQTAPNTYHGLHHSHPPIYGHMISAQHGIPSQVCQDRSPMSEYSPVPEYSMFYYPRANMAVESRPVCKDIGRMHSELSVPGIPKHPIAKLQEHHLLSQPVGTIASQNHSFLQGFDHQCYAVHRTNMNASQMRASLRRTHAPLTFQSVDLTTSPSSLKMDGHVTPLPNLHEDQLTTSLHVEQLQASPARLQVDQTAANKIMDQLSVSPSSVQINSPFAPRPVLHIDPASLNMNRPLNYSHYKAEVTCPKQPQSCADSLHALLSQSPTPHGVQIHNAATCSVNPVKLSCPPAIVIKKNRDASLSSLGNAVCEESLKRSISHTHIDHTTQSIKTKWEGRDSFEMGVFNKRQKVEFENVSVEADQLADTSPMPIIDSVFSLAPYKAYFKTSGVLLPAKGKSIDHLSELCVIGNPESCIQTNVPKRDGKWPVFCRFPKDELKGRPDNSTEKPVTQILEPTTIKEKKTGPQDADSSSETHVSDCKGNLDCYREATVKEEVEETVSSDIVSMLEIEKCEPDESENKSSIAVKHGMSENPKAGNLSADRKVKSKRNINLLLEETDKIPYPESITPPQPPNKNLDIQNLPPHLLPLYSYKIIFPNNLCPTSVENPTRPPVQPTVEVKPKSELNKKVRQHFLELHHSLCQLVSSFVSASPEKELRNWLSHFELTEPASSSVKVKNLSFLMGVKAREVWLSEDIKMTLHKVLQRLREYITLKQCPFPHVMRTGAVFIPMLVVKELLFPQVQGSFIDQVLQEHKVNLRPTTLSEEKSLTQLCKRSCSNKLKRLLSLKHLPDIYPDVVSLFYHACVHKHLAVELDEPAKRHPDEDSKETDPSKSPTYSDIIPSSLGSGSDEPRQLEDQKKNSQLNKHRTKGWVKSRSGHSVLEEEGVKCTVQLGDENVMPTLGERQLNQVKGIPEENPSHITPQEECEYLCPLSSDELGSSTSDTETEGASTLPGVNQSTTLAKCQERSKNHPGMILKLKKVSFNKDHHSRRACYQPVSTTGTVSNPSFSEAKNGQRKQTKRSKGDPRRKITSKVTHRWQITKRFSHALRLLSSSSPRRHQPLIKIKYCPFLSTFHSAEHRRRWVLRSAVQRARQAMTLSYPDLVGKRIQHLYEEDDKSEVWYRGEVVCIHEAHPNPLKTVFEVRYDSEPEWKYYLELLIDYKKGWLKID